MPQYDLLIKKRIVLRQGTNLIAAQWKLLFNYQARPAPIKSCLLVPLSPESGTIVGCHFDHLLKNLTSNCGESEPKSNGPDSARIELSDCREIQELAEGTKVLDKELAVKTLDFNA